LPDNHQQIIPVIRVGDEGSFRQIFNSHYANLCKYANTILRDMDEAEDVVQSVFLKILEKKESTNVTSDIKSYLYRAVHNFCINKIDYLKTRRLYQEQNILENSGKVQSPNVFPTELEDSILVIIDKLPVQCRKIFIMSRYNEMKYSEIADVLGISVNTIENQISKALKILRKELNDVIKDHIN
jgi:RNA polymerase sigma-70 factor, ECF subfamily